MSDFPYVMGRSTQSAPVFYEPLMHRECYEQEKNRAKHTRRHLLGNGIWCKLIANNFLSGKVCASCCAALLCPCSQSKGVTPYRILRTASGKCILCESSQDK